jgi:ribosome assembly protein 4
MDNINPNTAATKIKKWKPNDNREKNEKKVKREMFKGKLGQEEKEKLEIKKKENIKRAELNKKEEEEIPTQIVTKFISMEGTELNNEDTLTNEITLPTEITLIDLNKLINEKLLNNKDDPQLYQFYINDIQIKTNLKETLQKIKDFSSEKTYKIVYCPESLFHVKPLTRGGTILEGHTDSILTVQFSPDGNLLCSGGGDATLRFWDMETDTPLSPKNEKNLENENEEEDEEDIQLHNAWILNINFSPDGGLLVTGDVEGYFGIWDPKYYKPKIKKATKAHKKWITSISFKPLHLYKNENNEIIKFISTGKDGFLKLWNGNTGKIIISTAAHEQSITKTIWSGENIIYTCSEDQTVKVFDENLNHLQTLIGHSHWINTMALNTEYILRTGCFDYDNIKGSDYYQFSEKIKNLNLKEKILHAEKRYKLFKQKINSSEKLVTGSDDNTLILWDRVQSTKPLIRMTGHQGIVNDVKFSPNAFYLASASFDKCIKIWNANTGTFLFNLRGHVGPVYQIAWSPNSKMVLSCSKDSTLQCWNIQTKKMMHNLPGHADEIYTVDWSPNGIKAASGSKDRRVRIWVN